MASDSYPRPDFNGGEVTELLYERLVSVQAADGLVGLPTDPPLVYADGLGIREVKIRANRRALVRGFMYDSGPTDIVLTLPANTSGSTRIDLIVLRLTRSTWRVQEAFIQGTAGAGQPAPVAQADTGVWDLPVAAVTVANNAGGLGASTVKPLAWYVGSDGQILCTPDTRPPHELGRRVTESPTGLELVSTGDRWAPAADDLGVSALSFVNAQGNATGWSATYNRLYRRNGWVHFALSPQRTGGDVAEDATVTLGTLPAGYRPPYDFQHTGFAVSTGAGVVADIKASGQVTVTVYGGLLKSRFLNFAATSWPAV